MSLQNLSVGHYSNLEGGTGVTVFLFKESVTAAYWLCGSAPATRDIAVLDLENCVNKIDALVFSGGSAPGLGAANGAINWLREQGRGVPTLAGPVPIVPAAAIYDWNVKAVTIPTIDNAYKACVDAKNNNQYTGQVGASTGASIGKLFSFDDCMRGGFGICELKGPKELIVRAYAVVNCVGDVWDGDSIVAGAQGEKKQFYNISKKLQAGENYEEPVAQNTTLVFVATNAMLSQAQLKRLAKMSTAGMARAIKPAFTLFDGDIIFTASVGDVKAEELVVSELASEAVRQAIIKAVV